MCAVPVNYRAQLAKFEDNVRWLRMSVYSLLRHACKLIKRDHAKQASVFVAVVVKAGSKQTAQQAWRVTHHAATVKTMEARSLLFEY